MRLSVISAVILAAGVLVLGAQPSTFDLVIRGGRVIDPETGLDAVRDVGIAVGRIAAVSPEPLTGSAVIDARGLVVAPGFIDLHTHVNDATTYRLAAQEGVTAALDLEIGAPDVATFLEARRGKTPINFGSSASHPWSRVRAFGGVAPDNAIVPASQRGTETVAGEGEMQALRRRLEHELDAGALGIGMGLAYTPGATRGEVIDVFRVAATRRVPVFVHTRSSGRVEPGSSIESVGEVAGMTDLKSSVFNPGWQQRIGVTERDVAIPETGERLTAESFATYRAQPGPRLVLIYTNPDAIVDGVITDPLTMIASDAVLGHPRAAGAFARVLARYVREQRTLTLADAIRKMSLMPAQRLERATAAAARKGRLQAGADADIAVFDAATVADRATYAAPAVPAAGFRHVLVNGIPIVRDGQMLDAAPGRAIVRDR